MLLLVPNFHYKQFIVKVPIDLIKVNACNKLTPAEIVICPTIPMGISLITVIDSEGWAYSSETNYIHKVMHNKLQQNGKYEPGFHQDIVLVQRT